MTPEGVELALAEKSYSAAVMMSFRLNERELIVRSVEAVPVDDSESRPPIAGVVQIGFTCILPNIELPSWQ